MRHSNKLVNLVKNINRLMKVKRKLNEIMELSNRLCNADALYDGSCNAVPEELSEYYDVSEYANVVKNGVRRYDLSRAVLLPTAMQMILTITIRCALMLVRICRIYPKG